LEKDARAQGLAPALLAGLIRQESEFNPGAQSGANAWGLTQLQPPTAQQYAPRAGVPNFAPRQLFQPAVSLKIGAAYFKAMLDKHGGNLPQTLAAYNAGPNRLAQWLAWGLTYREPAEFIEMIPFTETRDYVQAVMRNEDMYKRLYQDAGAKEARR
jgi:soluble lytic murein transglycosylase